MEGHNNDDDDDDDYILAPESYKLDLQHREKREIKKTLYLSD